jgi:hypothetical protein
MHVGESVHHAESRYCGLAGAELRGAGFYSW